MVKCFSSTDKPAGSIFNTIKKKKERKGRVDNDSYQPTPTNPYFPSSKTELSRTAQGQLYPGKGCLCCCHYCLCPVHSSALPSLLALLIGFPLVSRRIGISGTDVQKVIGRKVHSTLCWRTQNWLQKEIKCVCRVTYWSFFFLNLMEDPDLYLKFRPLLPHSRSRSSQTAILSFLCCPWSMTLHTCHLLFSLCATYRQRLDFPWVFALLK